MFTFLKKQIDQQEVDTSTEFRYTYKLNEFSSGVGKDLEILSRFRHHKQELFKDALELIFYYAIRIPSKMPAAIYIIKEKFCFSRLGYMYGDRIQHLLLNFLIDKAKFSSNKEVYESALSEILPDYLKIEFRENEGDGRTITMHRFCLWLSKSIKLFRENCFNYLLFDAKKSVILQVLYRLNFYEYGNSNEILQHDKSFIFKIIAEHFNTNEFEDCFVLQQVLEGLDWLKVDYSKEINKENKSPLYQLAQILKRDRKRKSKLGWEEEEKLHQKELLEYCRDFDLDKYKSLLINVTLILEQIRKISRGTLALQYENSLNTIFGNLAQTDKNLFLEVLKSNFDKFRFNLNFTYIFNRFFQVTPQYYYELFEVIKDLEADIKFSYHHTLNIDSVKNEHLLILYSDVLRSIKSLTSQYIFWDLTFISKYKKLKEERDIYFEILEIVLSKIKKEEVKIGVGQPFLEKCLTFNNFSFEMLGEAYLYSINIQEHFDYDKNILKALLQRNSSLIIQLLKFNFQNGHDDLEHENFDFIWELDNYPEIITSIFEYFIASKTYYFSEISLAAFFPVARDKYNNKPVDYLKSLVDQKYLDDKYMDAVFGIICYKYPDLKMEFLERFLRLNTDVEVFKDLEIIKRSNSWSGSYIPILEGEKKIWENVISVLDGLPNRLNYYEHKEYANRQISYFDMRIKEEMKREFFEDFR